MKLSAIHTLLVEELAFPPILEDDDEGEKGEGSKKNEQSAAAQAYHAAGYHKQDDLAAKTGIPKSRISRYKAPKNKGGINPSPKALKDMAKAGVNPATMLKGVE